jgi:hypothetical protein
MRPRGHFADCARITGYPEFAKSLPVCRRCVQNLASRFSQARFLTTVMTDRLPCLVITKIFLTLPSISRMLLAL